MECIHCKKTFKNAGGLGAHKPYCESNPNRIKRKRSPNAGAKKGSTPWNKGLVDDPRCKHSELSKQKMRENSGGGIASTPELEKLRKEKISQSAKNNNGGYRQGSGRGKKGWYRGFFCDSSWELAYVIYCLDHQIDIKRNTEKRKYIWEGKIKNYIPDFIVNKVLVEIKGYKSLQWEAKQLANPDVHTLYEKDLKDVFSYVKSVYGKDFIKLYE